MTIGVFPEGEQRGRVRRASGGGGAKFTASGVPQEAFQPGDLAFPQISAPRARPSPPVFTLRKHSCRCRGASCAKGRVGGGEDLLLLEQVLYSRGNAVALQVREGAHLEGQVKAKIYIRPSYHQEDFRSSHAHVVGRTRAFRVRRPALRARPPPRAPSKRTSPGPGEGSGRQHRGGAGRPPQEAAAGGGRGSGGARSGPRVEGGGRPGLTSHCDAPDTSL